MKQAVIQAEARCQGAFARIQDIELEGTRRVLEAFQSHQVSARHFAPTTGYGYGDVGRDTLEGVFAQVLAPRRPWCGPRSPRAPMRWPCASLAAAARDHLLYVTGAL